MKALLYADIKDLKFKYIYRFIAFRRSGQHAIFEWLANNLDANVILVNNISGQKDSITLLNGDKIENKLNILFISIEDFDFKTEENKTYKSYIFDETILILRDQYNLFASRIKSNRKRFFTEYALYLYNQHLGLKDKYFTIEYNKWLIDDAYLKALKNKFNLLDIKKINTASKFGNGSSFVGINKVEANDLLNRYKHLTIDELNLINSIIKPK